MQNKVTTHVASTYQLLQRAFPNGIEENEYLSLLAIQHEHISDRNLAQAIAEFSGKNYYVVLNDVYKVGASDRLQSSDTAEQIKQKLISSGYEEWLASE